METETLSLSTEKSAPFSLRPWLLGWGLVLAALVVLLANDARDDTLAWRATRWLMGSQDSYVWEQNQLPPAAAGDKAIAWYRTTEPPLHGKLYKRTEKIWRVLRDLGEPFVTVILMAAVWIYYPRPRPATGVTGPRPRLGGVGGWGRSLALSAATVLAGLLGALLRFATGRLRPNGILPDGSANAGQNIWEFCRTFAAQPHFPWFTIGGSDLSFPSGHATLAFATAAALGYLSPRGRWLFLTIATGTALSRVIMQAHFYSDVLVGAALGYTLGYWTVRMIDHWLQSSGPDARVT